MTKSIAEITKEILLSDKEMKYYNSELRAAHLRATVDYEGRQEIARSLDKLSSSVNTVAQTYKDGRKSVFVNTLIVSGSVLFSAYMLAAGWNEDTTQIRCDVDRNQSSESVNEQIDKCKEFANYSDMRSKLTIHLK